MDVLLIQGVDDRDEVAAAEHFLPGTLSVGVIDLSLASGPHRQAARCHEWPTFDAMARDLRPVYTAPTEQAAKERLNEFHDIWGERYPAIIRL